MDISSDLAGVCRRFAFAAAAGLTFLFAGIASAAPKTLFVGPAGSDLNPGTLAAPLRQIRKAIAVSAPGDTVLLLDGSYLGFDLDGMAGTALAPFTIRALGQAATVTATADRSDNRDTIHVSFSSWVVLDGLRAFGANRAAVRIDQSDHVTVRNGVYGDNATWGIFTDFADDLVLENNECYGSVTQHGIYVSNSGDRPLLRGNRSHDNHGGGIQLNADLSQGGDGIITGALLENNVIWNNGTGGGAAINLDGVQSSTVRNNLLYGNHASGIANFMIDGAAGPSGMLIANNTIDMAADGRWAILVKSAAGANVLRNNILVNRNPARGGIVYGDANDVSKTDSDYNVLDAVSPDDSTRVLLASWQALGHETHSLSASIGALFRNASVADYHLASASPALDHGQTLAGVPLDLEGTARPGGTAFDIGAFETATPAPLAFFTLTPCRLLDTRSPLSAQGGPALQGGARRTIAASGQCGIPAGARAIAANITYVGGPGSGYLTAFADGSLQPFASTMNFRTNLTRANNAIVPLGPGGGFVLYCGAGAVAVDAVVDVDGYFQ
jgi:hypothetical protein